MSAIRRRLLIQGLAATAAWSACAEGSAKPAAVKTGADRLAADAFRSLTGKRVGLITNQTGRVGRDHLVDVMVRTGGLRLAAIFAPEHGFRGVVEAGATVADERDAKSGVRVFSLYGATKAPTAQMLADIDVLVFDIQDIGVRFYTYISTMGLAMAAAARRRIPFVVLDRPNPIGGTDISGFVLEERHRSFVGQYPIPIVHGMTVGELAHMIKGERWLPGLEALDVEVIACTGWQRAKRWPATGLPWVATSPNIPSFESALFYPGIGVVGETQINEGRGTPIPFQQFGAPWLDADALAAALSGLSRGVSLEPVRYVPRRIPNIAADPRFSGSEVRGIRLRANEVDAVRPLDIGIHALAFIEVAARKNGTSVLPTGAMFTAIAGTTRLRTLLQRGASGVDIIAQWQAETARFAARRTRYLLYT